MISRTPAVVQGKKAPGRPGSTMAIWIAWCSKDHPRISILVIWFVHRTVCCNLTTQEHAARLTIRVKTTPQGVVSIAAGISCMRTARARVRDARGEIIGLVFRQDYKCCHERDTQIHRYALTLWVWSAALFLVEARRCEMFQKGQSITNRSILGVVPSAGGSTSLMSR